MSNDRPLVSVIMNALNAERYMREAIGSVYAQTSGDWEIVFWDNASTDATAEIAQSFDERLRYFRGHETVPLGAARNLALAEARGEFIAFLDADDRWMPRKLELQLAALRREPSAGLVYANSIFFNQRTGRRRATFRAPPPTGMVFRELLGGYFLPMETVMLRRAALEAQREWFDPRFQVVEEAELFTRMAYAWPLAYVDEPLAEWRVHETSWTWMRNELFAVELSQMLDKFAERFEGFDERYAPEIARVRAKIAYREALAAWRKGEAAAVRRLLRPHLGARRALLLPMAMSFGPYSAYERVLRWTLRSP